MSFNVSGIYDVFRTERLAIFLLSFPNSILPLAGSLTKQNVSKAKEQSDEHIFLVKRRFFCFDKKHEEHGGS